jgi:hypothetical protein
MKIIFPERRHGRRYLTLKNAAFAGIALIVGFMLLTVWSIYRPDHSPASGNLFEPRATQNEMPRHEPLAVVEEGSIRDYPQAKSMLIDSAAPVSAPKAVPVTRTTSRNRGGATP